MIRRLICISSLLLAGWALVLTGCGKSSQPTATTSTPSGGAASSAGQQLTIAVIPKGTTHEYWKSVQAGAEQAGKDLGVNIEFKGPVVENDRSGQISIVQQFVSDGVNGIVLAPLDNVALVGPVKQAEASKIPVVIIDSSLEATPGTDFVSFVATDNFKGGQIAGQELIKLLNGKGKVVLLRYMVGSASTADREKGFLDAISHAPGITVVDQAHYAGATQGEAQTVAMQMIGELSQADGVFAPNESATLGLLAALKQNNLAGKIKFVGFDASPSIIRAIQSGDIDAVVAQNPVHMGYIGVQTVVDKIRGQTVPTSIDTGAAEIDKSNLNTPAIQKLLSGK